MKKSYRILFAVIILLSLTFLFGCKSKNDTSEGLKIVTTIFPTYDFSKSIVGEKGNVTLLLKPGEESHSYDPTPQDIIKIRECDLFIYIGGRSDAWVDSILDSVDSNKTRILTLIDLVTPIESGHGHDHGIEYDEHIWTSPKNAVIITEKISEEIIKADPENTDFYKTNTESYIKKLMSLDSELTKTVSDGKRSTVVFGDRFPFAYLARDYGLDYHAAFPGCSEESDVSAARVAELINIVKTEEIPVVFVIELSSGRVADSICAETGAEKLMLHSCNNITKDEFTGGETYISIMQKNIAALKKALD